MCGAWGAERAEEERTCERLIAGARRRDTAAAARMLDKLHHACAASCGGTGAPPCEHWKLDSWEDDARRRRRLVPDPRGRRHEDRAHRESSHHAYPHPPTDAILQVLFVIFL